jgi:serine/threonine protein kinase
VIQEVSKESEIDLLADPDLLLSSPACEVIKDQKKIRVGRLAMEIGGQNRNVFVKRYNVFSWRYRIGSLFGRSAALRSWLGAGILLQAGFHTGQPIAALEHRSWGMLTRSFYLSEEILEALAVDVYWCKDLLSLSGVNGFRRRRGFLESLADLFRSLHQSNIYHNDLKDANILVRAERGKPESFYLLDLEGIRKLRKLSARRKIKNLTQLNRTFGRLVRNIDKLFFLRCYLGGAFLDRRENRKWIRRVLEESERRDRRSLLSADAERGEAHGP